MKTIINPRLILVGAGPGDLELITLKGIKALEQADVVLYDALIDDDLLQYAPKAKHVFVGKRKGNHRYSQEEINKLIVKYALSHGTVVRLKGGDPFVFGRGSEEIEFAESFGVATEVVPGISSSTAVPANQGVSLTKRNVSESFWVLTGTTKKGQLSEDIALAAQSTATLVVLMGMSKLKEIVNIFINQGRADTPVAIIQNGTTKNEKIGIGTIDTIEAEVKSKNLSSPAIIVIGEVVRYSTKFSQFYHELALTHKLN